MSYQALARRWRPREFSTLVGQDHVVRALRNALQTQRLHHAYLFTGTRGVGKTTLARILAKALNCIGPDGRGGVTPDPCNACAACTAIDAGRFVDYIEMDAASNRGVDEMTQLLERAAYAPSDARFKIYTIDEVHMLSTHAFNAMLKTLEEPPEYVKFILATTDPQKIPVTVLSRCLQFNLKQVAPAAIAERLAEVLASEKFEVDGAALRALAQAARGSMRDALSLLDQAIAFSGGAPDAGSVQQMLGALDSGSLVALLDAIGDAQAPRVLALADAMAERGIAFSQAMRDLASLVHRVALVQGFEGALQDDPDAAELRRLAGRFTREQIQLYYQIAIHGRDDLHLAPDEYAGFTMSLLRMLAFAPELGASAARSAPLVAARPPRTTVRTLTPGPSPAKRERGDESAFSGLREKGEADTPLTSVRTLTPGPSPAKRERGDESAFSGLRERGDESAFSGLRERGDESAFPRTQEKGEADSPLPAGEGPGVRAVAGAVDWPVLAARLKLSGLARELALHSELLQRDGDHFILRVPVKALLEAGNEAKVRAALTEHFGRPVRLTMQVGSVSGETAAGRAEVARASEQRQAEDAIYADPFVRELIENFGATVDPRSIRPTTSEN
jgi:DNA polymerase III subunit gamma/tau